MGGNETVTVDVRVIAATNREPASGWSRRGSSARISTTGSTSSASRCRRCACVRRTCSLLASHFLRKYAGREREGAARLLCRGARAPHRLQMAGERPGARERRRAGGRPGPVGGGDAGGPAAATRGGQGPGRPADSRGDHGRDRALRHHEDARVDGGLHQPRRRDPEHERAQDPVQAPRVRERAQVGPSVRERRRDRRRAVWPPATICR